MKSHFGAGLWPVVRRELRETARRPLNHWLRCGGAFCGLMVLSTVTSGVPDTFLGSALFNNMHRLLLSLICLMVPALTADCIARERREGTLGLLFMTPLTASAIVVGKVVAQVLRALTLWLAVMPLLTIPFLYGGVTWGDVAVYLTIELCVGMLCLAAGIVASSLTDHRALAFILAFLLTGALVGGGLQYQNQKNGGRLGTRMTVFAPSGFRVQMNGVSYSAPTPYALFAPRIGFASRQQLASVLAEEFFIAGLILLLSIRFAGNCVERSWQDKIPSVRQKAWVKRYCSPLFANSFARGMKRTLEWNPIAWLQQYSWKARVSKWGLCLLFIALECFFIRPTDLNGFAQLLMFLLLIMIAAYTYAGVNGFLEEKKTGALELILVSPISVNQIIFGRVWGLWKQFLPSALLLVGSDIAFHQAIGQNRYYYGGSWATAHGDWHWLADFEIVAIYLTLPVIATCLALTSKNLFVASALTVAIVFGPALMVLFPGLLSNMMTLLHMRGWMGFLLHLMMALAAFPITVFAVHGYSAMLAYRYLQHSLRRRSYAY